MYKVLTVLCVCILCVLQYLKFEEFEETVQSFDKECISKGKLVSKPQGTTLRDSKTLVIKVKETVPSPLFPAQLLVLFYVLPSKLSNVVFVIVSQKDLLCSFDDGDHKVFFELWTNNISPEVKDSDADAQTLEFYLYIHFTIYPLRKNLGGHVCKSPIFNTKQFLSVYLKKKKKPNNNY